MRLKKRYIVRTVIGIVFGFLLLGLGFAINQYYRLEVSNFRSWDGKEHSYKIYPGATIDSVMNLIRAEYEIGSEANFSLHTRMFLFNYPEPGHYTFPAQIGDKELINRLKYGIQTPVRITWNNSARTTHELAEKVTTNLLMDQETLFLLLDSNEYMAAYGMDRETSRCLFIPNTYEVMWDIKPDALFRRMQREYNAFWNESRRHKADSIGLTPIEVAIVASIVEGETYRKSDMPLIASLYINRLHKGMPLQACPTIKYAVGDFNLKRVLYRHLKVESPYNTYKNKGLPPGPIRCPLPSTMDFVLSAPKTDYLYMCANPALDGTHIFSSSYGKHTSAAHEYHRMMNETSKQK